jgi:hypothetical protein
LYEVVRIERIGDSIAGNIEVQIAIEVLDLLEGAAQIAEQP